MRDNDTETLNTITTETHDHREGLLKNLQIVLEGGISQKILRPADSSGLQDAMRDLKSTGRFTKLLAHKSAIDLMSAVERKLKYIAVDQRCTADLAAVSAKIKERSQKVNLKARQGCYLVSIQECCASWRDVREALTNIDLQASDAFRAEYAADLKACTGTLQKAGRCSGGTQTTTKANTPANLYAPPPPPSRRSVQEHNETERHGASAMRNRGRQTR